MRARWRLFVACTPAAMVQGLDVAMVNVALPSIGVRLSAELADLQWVVAATALALVSLLPTGGAFGDLYGRRSVLLFGYGLLMLGALVAWAATSMAMLLPARVLQRVGIALGFPNSLATVALAFPPRERGRAVAVWTAISSLVFAVSPVVGGLLVGAFGFNAIFLPAFGLAAVGAAGTWMWIPRGRPIRERTLDVSGLALGTAALSLLSYGLIEGGRGGFGQPLILMVLGAGLWCTSEFLSHELRIAHPMLDVRFVTKVPFGPIVLVTFVLYTATNAVMFLMAIYLQALRGLSPATAGLVMLAFSTPVFLGAPLGGYLNDRVGFRRPVMAVLPILAVAALLLARAGPGTPLVGYVALGMALVGILNGVFFVISSTSAVTGVPEHQTSAMAATLPAARQLAGVVGVMLAGVLATVTTRARLSSSLEAPEELSIGGFGWVADGAEPALVMAYSEASFFAYSMVMLTVAAGAVAVAALVFRLMRGAEA